MFHSIESGKPFSRCSRCQNDLIHSGNPYFIHKDWSTHDINTEFAVCHECIAGLEDEVSEESRRSLQGFLRNGRGLFIHQTRISGDKGEEMDINRYVDHCIICAEGIERPGQPYSMSCMCSGNEMILGVYPLAVCSPCESKAAELLSKQTRDAWEGFYDPIVNAPPSDVVDLPGKPKIPVIF